MPIVAKDQVNIHPEFFFQDGNIVLIAGTLAFRLHRGIVNRWSPVLRTMLDALDAAPDPWVLGDCGIIVLEDDPLDVEKLIRALYDGSTPGACTVQTFAHLTSLLILSHKYAIPQVHAPALAHLLVAYPLTLSAWDAREAYELTCDRLATLRARYATHSLAVVSLALQLDAPHLLVTAYLDLARLPVSEIVCGYTPSPPAVATLHLPVAQTTAVLRGKETLQRFIADFLKTSVEARVPALLCRYVQAQDNLDGEAPTQNQPESPCTAAFSRVTHEILVMTAGVDRGIDSDPLYVLWCAMVLLKGGAASGINGAGSDLESGQEQACAACIESFRQTIDVAREHIWASLPKWFDLRKLLEGGFEAGWGSE